MPPRFNVFAGEEHTETFYWITDPLLNTLFDLCKDKAWFEIYQKIELDGKNHV